MVRHVPKTKICKNCKKKVMYILGDKRPQKVECPYCKYVWLVNK